MASTLQNIRSSIQLQLLPVPIDRIFYGLNNTVDVDVTPFITFTDFRLIKTYDTCGAIYSESTFYVHIFANSLELAEEIALATNDQLELKKVTPTTMTCFQNSYSVVQEDARGFSGRGHELSNLYIFHVSIEYDLKETY